MTDDAKLHQGTSPGLLVGADPKVYNSWYVVSAANSKEYPNSGRGPLSSAPA